LLERYCVNFMFCVGEGFVTVDNLRTHLFSEFKYYNASEF